MTTTNDWLTVALPKGRLAKQTLSLLIKAGLLPPGTEPGHRLIIENPTDRIRYVWLRPADTLTYVERGVAAVGVAGKDVLEEALAAVDELYDLGIGRCRISVATPGGKTLDQLTPSGRLLRIATHLPNLTQRYFDRQGRAVETIYLRGSVEIAPSLGLADAVVDIVETGSTLAANGLVEVEKIMDVTSRLIVNPGARRGGDPRLGRVIDAIIAASQSPVAGGTGS